MTFKKVLFPVIAVVLLMAACGDDTGEENEENGAQEQAGNEEEPEKAITIGLDPYDYATVPAYLSKEILEREGYDVTIQEAEVGILFAALAEEDIDAFVDIWAPNLQSTYLEEYEGQFDIVGTLYSGAPVGMAVPTFMEDMNSTEQLNDYKEEFDGMLYAVDAGSGMDQTTRKLIDAYDLDYEITNSSTPAMIAQAERMINNEEPIVFNAWRPHTMFKLLDIKMLEDPKDIWGSDDVQIGTVFDLEARLPEAHTLFSNMEVSLDEV